MSFSLGLDTGGTYTDAVIFDDAAGRVVAKAKALTTRHDLSVGIAEAAGNVIAKTSINVSALSLVSISTTLATNALVEGQGGRIALVMIGFSESDLARGGLKEALGDEPVIFLPGGHDSFGKATPLDMQALEDQIDGLADKVSAFAVAGYFAVRNPEHENAVRDFIATRTQCAVTCSHELSSKLDGPKRALTTLLNARLIGMIARLLEATQHFLSQQNIGAPLMVVRGDGSLVSADFALMRPIETILSGPAASSVGAHFLTGMDDAIVADIGGTTTDIAILDKGQPRIDAQGAAVGGYRTMVEAVAMRTYGLGGDSEVWIDESGLKAELKLGPRRLVPISLLAQSHEALVMETLNRQLGHFTTSRLDGSFAFHAGLPPHAAAGLSKSQEVLLERITHEPQALDRLLKGTAEVATLNALVMRGVVLIAGITPSDAQHYLGEFSHWKNDATALALTLFARRKEGSGQPIAADGTALATDIIACLKRKSAERVLESVFFEDGLDGAEILQSPLIERALERKEAMARLALFLDRPLIGLGAGAAAYYPGAADIIGAQCHVPDDADVANAIGAVVGQVRVQVSAEILLLESGQFEIVGPSLDLQSHQFDSETVAIDAAKKAAELAAFEKARAAGAANISTTIDCDIQTAPMDGTPQFVSATIVATANGRPSTARNA